jgi:2-keto-4-pentenoate hydratase/2-oxohepta-3-ene-1,7-dioic acid hydratase in catechol pathway
VSVPAGQFAVGRFDAGDGPFPGLVLPGDLVLDLRALEPSLDSLGTIFETWDESLETLTRIAAEPPSGGRPLGELHALAPVEPSAQILQSGANYRKHVVELAVDARIGDRPDMTLDELREETARMMDERAATGEPYVFLGSQAALCGAYDDVHLPARGEQHDWELELALVIGRAGRHVREADALEHVAGYTICNDLTTRDLVRRLDMPVIGSDWVRSKNAPTFLPTGPYLVPARFVPDPNDLRITLRLNGDVMQDESTADMMFRVPRLIAYASSLVQLRPGDLLLTGDVMDCEITGLGAQRTRCRPEPQSVGAATGSEEARA